MFAPQAGRPGLPGEHPEIGQRDLCKPPTGSAHRIGAGHRWPVADREIQTAGWVRVPLIHALEPDAAR